MDTDPSNNPALVIDNGTGFMKAGMAGDDAPKTIFPSVVGIPYLEGIHGAQDKKCYVGDEAKERKGVLTLKYPLEHGIIKDWDLMQKIWRSLYFDELKLQPKEHYALLTEAALNPKQNREKITEIFFEDLEVPGFFICTQAILALYAGGRTTGLVCDSGDGVTHLVIVYDGFSVKHATRRINLAGRNLTDYMCKHLAEYGYNFQTTGEQVIAQEIKEQKCYVPLDYEEELKEFETDETKS